MQPGHDFLFYNHLEVVKVDVMRGMSESMYPKWQDGPWEHHPPSPQCSFFLGLHINFFERNPPYTYKNPNRTQQGKKKHNLCVNFHLMTIQKWSKLMIWEGHLSQHWCTTMRSLTKKKEKKTGLPEFFVRQTLGDLRWKDGMGFNMSNMRFSLSCLIHPLGNLQYNVIIVHYVVDKQFQIIHNELFYVHYSEYYNHLEVDKDWWFEGEHSSESPLDNKMVFGMKLGKRNVFWGLPYRKKIRVARKNRKANLGRHKRDS